MDGEGRSRSPWHTRVLVCKETVRKTKKKAVFYGAKGEFTGMGQRSPVLFPRVGRAFGEIVLAYDCAHPFVLTEEQSCVGNLFIKHIN